MSWIATGTAHVDGTVLRRLLADIVAKVADHQNSTGRGRDFRIQDARDLTPRAKFTGDFGNTIEVMRISDRSLLSVFAKNLEPCNF